MRTTRKMGGGGGGGTRIDSLKILKVINRKAAAGLAKIAKRDIWPYL